jgi:ribonuclease HII
VEEIDCINILQATLLAMKRAVEGLHRITCADKVEVLVDGLHVPRITHVSRAIVEGDRLIEEISAASILAKTARDAEMCAVDAAFPQYGFRQHKGYGTAQHMKALKAFGPCPHHRHSFAPVRAAASQRAFDWDVAN